MKKELLFGALILFIGLCARAFDGWDINVMRPGIGQLIWLVFPMILALLFQRLGKNKLDWGLSPNLPESWKWFLFSFLLFPLLCIGLIAIGNQVGWIAISDEQTINSILLFICLAIPGAFIKNIFEEFIWRGYLFSSLNAEDVPRLQNHILIGIIWGLWHLPYLDAFSSIYHDLNWYIYVPLFLIGVVLTSIIYGEVRLRSGTVWTAVIMHTMANAVVNTLFLQEFIQLKRGFEWVISPSVDNIGYILFTGLAAWLLYSLGTRKSSSLQSVTAH